MADTLITTPDPSNSKYTEQFIARAANGGPELAIIVTDPQVSPDLLEQVVTQPSLYSVIYPTTDVIVDAILKNPNSSSALKSVVIQSTNPFIQKALANYPEIVATTLTEMAISSDVNQRIAAARNHFTSPELLSQLALDEAGLIRACVADNPNTPTDSLASLARDLNPDIRARVAKNPTTLPKTVVILSLDPNEHVRQATFDNDEVAKDKVLDDFLSGNSPHAGTKNDVQYKLDVLRQIASDPTTPPETLQAILNAKDSLILLPSIAKNPASPPELLEKLLTDEYLEKMDSVLMSNTFVPAILQNPNSPKNTLDILKNSQTDIINARAEAIEQKKPFRTVNVFKKFNDSKNKPKDPPGM